MDGHRAGFHGPSPWRVLLESLNSLRVLGRRSVLALVGVTIGCAAVVALLNIGRNATHEAADAFKGLGANVLLVNFPPKDSTRRPPPLALDLPAWRAAVPDIEYIAPLSENFTQLHYRGQSADGHIFGTTADLFKGLDFKPAQGRLLSSYDDGATFALAGASVAQKLAVRPGSRIQIGAYFFEIVGIIRSVPANPLIPVMVNESIFIPMAGMRRMNATPEIGNVVVWMRGAGQEEEKATALRTYLEEVVKGRSVEVQAPQQLIGGMARQDHAFAYLLGGVAVVSLLVGGIGIMNVMVMNVSERRREIGLRMAIGARARDIRSLFLMEAAVLSVAGAVLGAVFGLMAAYAFVRFSGWAFSLAPMSLPLGILSSLVVGLFFGLHPAIAAARLQPVQALRDD
ncbi:MAG: ABC transporter permease [Gallionellaceae bacterium]|nr:ABC transporter permease [Gallionellaceae bacterium]